jgi:hypothetical protein
MRQEVPLVRNGRLERKANLMWLEILWLVTAAVLFCPLFLPARYQYLSSRKRRAVRLALDEFAKTCTLPHKSCIGNVHCGIYKTEADRCIVMIPQASCISPPILTFYSVPDGSDHAIFLGAGQCRWGSRPEDLWEDHSINAVDPEPG